MGCGGGHTCDTRQRKVHEHNAKPGLNCQNVLSQNNPEVRCMGTCLKFQAFEPEQNNGRPTLEEKSHRMRQEDPNVQASLSSIIPSLLGMVAHTNGR